MVWYKNELKSLIEWCEELNLDYNLMRQRITAQNWDAKTAFESPKLKNGSQKPKQSNFMPHMFGVIAA